MYRLFFLVALFTFSIPGFSFWYEVGHDEKVEVGKGIDLRVMTYNIRHANPPSKPDSIDIDAIVRVISAEEPDLVALQEIDDGTRRSGTGNQAEIIAEKLGMNYFFGKAIDFDNGEYGVAILSRWTLSDQTVHRLPGSPADELRVLATVRVELADGSSLIFGSTHLDHKKDSSVRLEQMQRIQEISSTQPLPLVVAGDFNAAPGSPAIDLFDQEFTRTCGECAPTYPAVGPEKAIDFIGFKDRQGQIRVKKHEVKAEPYPSDHLPVSTILEIIRK